MRKAVPVQVPQKLSQVGRVERCERTALSARERFEFLDVPSICFEGVRGESALDFEIVQKSGLQNRTVTPKYWPRTRITARSPTASMVLNLV